LGDAAAERALVGEEEPTREFVARLATIELELDAVSNGSVVQVAQDVRRLHDAAECGSRRLANYPKYPLTPFMCIAHVHHDHHALSLTTVLRSSVRGRNAGDESLLFRSHNYAKATG
jgi:hypothetical protein